jgi:LPPG:FO 2-phospho-L-lactate transferase
LARRALGEECARRASTTAEVLEAISEADIVVIGPSSPVASIEPILALPGVRDRLVARRSTVVAVTPIVTGMPIIDEGDAQRARARRNLMRARGLRHRSAEVAGLYSDIAGAFVLDRADEVERPSIEANDQRVVIADTVVSSGQAGRALAQVVWGSPAYVDGAVAGASSAGIGDRFAPSIDQWPATIVATKSRTAPA